MKITRYCGDKVANPDTLLYNTHIHSLLNVTMTTIIKRLTRSWLGTLVVYRIFKKIYKAASLKKALRKRRSGILIKSVSELNLLMEGRAYLHDLEVPFLARSAQKTKGVIVEIGCAFGASSAIFLTHANPTTILHSIDPFVVDSMAPFQATKEKCARNVKYVLKAVGRPENVQQWNLHADYSYNLTERWHTPIDLLFIDGDHNYEAVRKDFIDWLPYVKTGGIILFHDSRKEPGSPADTFNRGWAGPTRLADELRSDKRVELINEVYSITAWKKI